MNYKPLIPVYQAQWMLAGKRSGSGPPPTGHLLNTLISYWKLDEASGTRADSQGTNNLTPSNAPVGVAGKINNGCKFVSASGQYLAISDNPSLEVTSDFTFSLWVNFTSLVAASELISKDGAAGTGDYGIYPHSTAGLVFWVNNSSLYAVAVGTPPILSTWYHVLAWFDSSDQKLRLRINDTTTYVSTMTCVLGPSGNAFSIGAGSYTGAGGFFDGVIDEVGFWKRKLTATEITALYNGGAGLPYSSFTA